MRRVAVPLVFAALWTVLGLMQMSHGHTLQSVLLAVACLGMMLLDPADDDVNAGTKNRLTSATSSREPLAEQQAPALSGMTVLNT